MTVLMSPMKVQKFEPQSTSTAWTDYTTLDHLSHSTRAQVFQMAVPTIDDGIELQMAATMQLVFKESAPCTLSKPSRLDTPRSASQL